MGRVRARVGFSDCQRCQRPLGDARQQSLLLLLVAEIDQRLHRMEIRRPDDAGRGARLADLAHASEIGGVGEASSAMRLGHKDRIEAERVDRPDIVPRELAGAVVVLGARRDLVPRKRPHTVEDLPLLGREWQERVKAVEKLHALSLILPIPRRTCPDRAPHHPRRSALSPASALLQEIISERVLLLRRNPGARAVSWTK
jgi:hypothetical protein